VRNAAGARPAARWGHTLTIAAGACGILIGGQGEAGKLMPEGVWRYSHGTDCVVYKRWGCRRRLNGAPRRAPSGAWEELTVSGDVPKKRMGHSSVYRCCIARQPLSALWVSSTFFYYFF
jgi:hypothetical protein